MTNLQIGVVGTFADKKVSQKLYATARDVGRKIAKRGYTLVFGPELDGDSLSTQAALAAKQAGGKTIGILYGSGNLNKIDINDPDKKNKLRAKKASSNIIWTGAERGGPRESILALSCNGLIAISGGSGTLTEMLIAYMNHIPVVVIENTGGWADKMANRYFDHRKRARAVGAKTPTEAVDTLIKLIKNS